MIHKKIPNMFSKKISTSLGVTILALFIVATFLITSFIQNARFDLTGRAATLVNPPLVVYDDALRNNYTYSEQGTGCLITFQNPTHFTGTYSMEINLNHFCTTTLHQQNDATFNIDNYTNVEFDIYGVPPNPETIFNVALNDTHYSAVGSDVPITNYVQINSTWQHVSIPLTAFNVADGTQITGLSFRSEENNTNRNHVLFDNIRFTQLPDTAPPTLAAIRNSDLGHMTVTFSERISSSDANNSANYTITSTSDAYYGGSGRAPTQASLASTGKDVTLTLPQAMINNTVYTLHVSNIHDLATPTPNVIAPNSTINLTAIQRTANMTINAGQNVHAFNPLMRGAGAAQWMHAANIKRDAYIGNIPELGELSRQMKLGLVRYAGGNWANAYIWDPTNTIDEWSTNNRIYNADQMDSLYSFKQTTGTEVMIQANICSNNPSMWAQMLTYTNVTHNYNFKYWELGSENNYDECANGQNLNPLQVASRVAAYRTALLAVDPTIKIVSPATAGFGGCPENPDHCTFSAFPNYNDVDYFRADTNAVPNIDFLAWHWYTSNEGYGTTGCDLEYSWLPQTLFNYNTAITNCYLNPGDTIPDDPTANGSWLMGHRRRFAEVSASWLRNIYLSNHPNTMMGITELNTAAGAGVNPIEGNHVAALWFSDILGRLAYSGYDLNTMYDLYDSTYYGMVYPIDDVHPQGNIHIRPTYYTMLMYGKWFGNQLVQSTTTAPNQEVSIWASKDTTDPNKLKLIVTNLSAYNYNATVNISNLNFTPTSGAFYELDNPDPLNLGTRSAEDSGGDSINGSVIDTSSATAITNSVNAITGQTMPVGNTFTHSFPAYTATAIILSNTGGSTPTPTPTRPAPPTPTPVNCNNPRADVDHSHVVDISDFNAVKQLVGKACTNCAEDVVVNGVVDIRDINAVRNNFNCQY